MDNISEITRQEFLGVIKDGVVVMLSRPTYVSVFNRFAV